MLQNILGAVFFGTLLVLLVLVLVLPIVADVRKRLKRL